MSRIDTYRQALRSIDDWEPYLLAESGLPGPRGNIELAQAVADEGDEPLFLHLLSFDATSAPTNTPQEFLAFCGVVGLGRLWPMVGSTCCPPCAAMPTIHAGACARALPWPCSAGGG